MIEAAELRAILAAAKQPLRAMILLAMNAGYGQTDIANLPKTAVDLDRGWVIFPRPKTAVERRCPLWPETVAVLCDAAHRSARRRGPCRCRLGFHHEIREAMGSGERTGTRRGGSHRRRWLEFRKLLVSLDLKRGGFVLQPSPHFQNHRRRAKDQPAIDLIMGHLSEGMAVHYRERIADDRLKAVVAVVRQLAVASGRRIIFTSGRRYRR